MDDENFILYVKLQNLYVDGYELVCKKKYYQSIEKFNIVYNTISDFLVTNKDLDGNLEKIMIALKTRCQQQMDDINNYINNDETINIDESDIVMDNIENDIIEIEKIDKPNIKLTSFMYRIFPCFQIKEKCD